MAELAQEEPELLQHFHKLSEAAGKVGMCKNIYVKYLCAKQNATVDCRI